MQCRISEKRAEIYYKRMILCNDDKDMLRIVLYIIIFATVLWLQMAPFGGIDIWWHLRVGQDIVERGIWPWPDGYTYTVAGHDSTAHQWLAGCMLWYVYSLVGETGLWLLRVIVHAATLIEMGLLLRLRRNAFILSCLIILIEAHCLSFRLIRPQIFTPLLLCFVLWQFEKWKQDGFRIRSFLFLLALIALWSNIHGGFAFGAIASSIYIFFSDIRMIKRNRLEEKQVSSESCTQILRLMMFQSIWIAASVNPEGPLGLVYGLKHLGSPTNDWHPPIPFTNPFGMTPVLWLSLLALAYMTALAVKDSLLTKGKKKINADLLIAIFCLVSSLLAVRFIWLVPIGLCFSFLPDRQEISLIEFQMSEFNQSRRKLIFVAILLGALGLAMGRFEYSPESNKIERSVCVARLMNIKGNIFNLFTLGGYLMWRMPESKIFIDTRVELFKDRVMDEYFMILEWDALSVKLLNQHHTDIVLLPNMDLRPFTLTKDKDFARVFASATSSIYLSTNDRVASQWNNVVSYYKKHGLTIDRENPFYLYNALLENPEWLISEGGFDERSIHYWSNLVQVGTGNGNRKLIEYLELNHTISSSENDEKYQMSIQVAALTCLAKEWMKHSLYVDAFHVLEKCLKYDSNEQLYLLISECARKMGDDRSAEIDATKARERKTS